MILYILCNETTKYTKIGITDNLERRISQLENANGCDLILIAHAEVDHAQIIESFLHSTFSKFRKRGEWFFIDEIKAINWLENFWISYFPANEKEWFFYAKVPVLGYEYKEEFKNKHKDKFYYTNDIKFNVLKEILLNHLERKTK